MLNSKSKDTNNTLQNKDILGNILHKKIDANTRKLALSKKQINDSFAEKNRVDKMVGHSAPNSFPIDIFSQPLQEYIVTSSKFLSREFIAGAILSALSTVIGDKLDLDVRGDDDYIVKVCSTYIALIGRTGIGKTPCLNVGLGAISGINNRLAKNKLDDGTIQQLMVKDATKEAVFLKMVNSKKGLLYVLDELKGLLDFDSYGQNSRSFYLEAYNGGSYNQVRIGRGDTYAEKTCLNIIGGLQNAFLSDLAKNGNDESGMTYRFLYILDLDYKKPNIPLNSYIKPSDRIRSKKGADKCNYYTNLINGLYNCDIEHRYYLSENAYYEWAEKIHNKYNNISNNEETDSKKNGVYAKLEQYCLRFAIILQKLADHETGLSQPSEEVSLDTMKKAIKLTEYFEQNAKKAFKIIEENSVPDIVFRASELLYQGKSYNEVSSQLKCSKAQISRWKSKFSAMFPTQEEITKAKRKRKSNDKG